MKNNIRENMDEDNELILFDRLEAIKMIYKKYNLENTCYISFSGGKDSTVLSNLFDEAIPGNRIPRVYINTGIEYNDMVDYVHSKMKTDDRIIEIKPTKPIIKVLNEYGYPFKSKEHSRMVYYSNKGSKAPSITDYFEHKGLSKRQVHCPKKLMYQQHNAPFLISDMCCYKLKKEPVHMWEKQNNRRIRILGIRTGEGGYRIIHSGCVVLNKDKSELKVFKPLNPVSKEFEDWYIKSRNIELCKLYYPPFNFDRTGCKGCPYALNLQSELDIMKSLLPNEKAQCDIIWKPVYEEYKRIGYRLKHI